MIKVGVGEVYREAFSFIARSWPVVLPVLFIGAAVGMMRPLWGEVFFALGGDALPGLPYFSAVDLGYYAVCMVVQGTATFAFLHYAVSSLRGEARLFPRHKAGVRLALFLLISTGWIFALLVLSLLSIFVGGFGPTAVFARSEVHAEVALLAGFCLVLLCFSITIYLMGRWLMPYEASMAMGESYNPARAWRLARGQGMRVACSTLVLPGLVSVVAYVVITGALWSDASASNDQAVELALKGVYMLMSMVSHAIAAVWYVRLSRMEGMVAWAGERTGAG